MGTTYDLETEGDPVEARAWASFVAEEFPSYEVFWRERVVPLTKRPEAGGFRPKAELVEMGKPDQEVCLAQLQYTVLGHLLVAYDFRQNHPVGAEGFVHAMVRLSAAGDVAHEFLERLANPDAYGAWSEKDGDQARRVWRKDHPDLDDVHNYRNRLLHGRLPMTLFDPTSGVRWFPRLGEAIDLDWREVTETFDLQRAAEKFETANHVLDEAWQRVLVYLEANWKAALA